MNFKNVMLYGLFMSLAPFAHMVRYDSAPVLATFVEWFMYCTAFIYFGCEYVLHKSRQLTVKLCDMRSIDSVIVMAIYVLPVKHVLLLTDSYVMFENLAAVLFLAWFIVSVRYRMQGTGIRR